MCIRDRPVGLEPALNALYFPLPSWFNKHSDIIDLAEFPVHKNKTFFIFKKYVVIITIMLQTIIKRL